MVDKYGSKVYLRPAGPWSFHKTKRGTNVGTPWLKGNKFSVKLYKADSPGVFHLIYNLFLAETRLNFESISHKSASMALQGSNYTVAAL